MDEPKNEVSKLTYDDRRKVLVQEKSHTMENIKPAVEKDGKVIEKEQHFSTVESSMKVTYNESGIRLAHKGLIGRKDNLTAVIGNTNEEIESLNEAIEKSDLPEMPEDLKSLKEKLEEIQKYAGLSKQKADLEKKQTDLIEMSTDLKKTEKDIKDMTDKIGSRLKL